MSGHREDSVTLAVEHLGGCPGYRDVIYLRERLYLNTQYLF